MLQGTGDFPIFEARTCRTGTPRCLPHFGIACQGRTTRRITRSVRRKSEERPKVPNRQNFTRTSPELQFLLLHAKHGCRNRPRSPGYARPRLRQAQAPEPGYARSEANAIASSSQTSLQSPQTSIFRRPVGWANLCQVLWLAPVLACSKCELFVSCLFRNEVCSGQKGTIKGCRTRFTALMPHSAVEMAKGWKGWQWKSDFMT